MGRFNFSIALISFFTLRILSYCEAQFGSDSVSPNKWGEIPLPRLDRTMSRGDNFGFIDEIVRQKCSKVKIPNGSSKMRDRGSLVRYQCNNGFMMYGIEWAICIQGRWSHPAPICVRNGSGCRKFPPVLNGSTRYLYGSSIVGFTCNEGFDLIGSSLVVCNGQRWNSTAPVCKGKWTPSPSTTELIESHEPTTDSLIGTSSEIIKIATTQKSDEEKTTGSENSTPNGNNSQSHYTISLTPTSSIESDKSTTPFFRPSDFDFPDLDFKATTDEITTTRESEIQDTTGNERTTQQMQTTFSSSEKSQTKIIESITNIPQIETTLKQINELNTTETTHKIHESTNDNSITEEISTTRKILETTTEKAKPILTTHFHETTTQLPTTEEKQRTTEASTTTNKMSFGIISTEETTTNPEKRKIPITQPTTQIPTFTTAKIIDYTIPIPDIHATDDESKNSIVDYVDNTQTMRNEIDKKKSSEFGKNQTETRGIRTDDVLKIFDKTRLREEESKISMQGHASFSKIGSDKSHDYFIYTIPILAGLIFVTMVCGMFVYIWKRYQGISRRSMYEADGRPLSFATTEAHEEFTWMENSSL